MIYKSFAGTDLSEAKTRRAQAEMSREQAETEALRTTRALCERMKAESEREMEEVKLARVEVARIRQDADVALARSKEFLAEAEEKGRQVIADGQRKGDEVIEQARLAAQQEATDLRRQSLKEIRSVLTRVEEMRAAMAEELETQRILTNVAELRASSRWLATRTVGNSIADDAETPEAAESPGDGAVGPPEGIAADAVGTGASSSPTSTTEKTEKKVATKGRSRGS